MLQAGTKGKGAVIWRPSNHAGGLQQQVSACVHSVDSQPNPAAQLTGRVRLAVLLPTRWGMYDRGVPFANVPTPGGLATYPLGRASPRLEAFRFCLKASQRSRTLL